MASAEDEEFYLYRSTVSFWPVCVSGGHRAHLYDILNNLLANRITLMTVSHYAMEIKTFLQNMAYIHIISLEESNASRFDENAQYDVLLSYSFVPCTREHLRADCTMSPQRN